MRVLMGAVPGPTAQEFRYRVQWTPGSLVGLMPIESVAYVNRATTANDDTQITALLDRATRPAVYAADLSGNGGGGKLHYYGSGIG
jgi:hypothetical protein